MGLQVQDGPFEALATMGGEGFWRCRFAQRSELGAGERKLFHQERRKLAAGIDDFGDGRFAEGIGDAGIEAERLKTPVQAHNPAFVAVILVGEKPGEQLWLVIAPVGRCDGSRQVAFEQPAEVPVAQTA